MGNLRHHSLLAVIPLFLLVVPAYSQVTLMDEAFDGPGFPPPLWSELNNGISAGWDWRNPGEAVHPDYFGANDNRLVSPELDFTALTEVALHGEHGQLFATYRDRNEVEVSLDGGLTFQLVYAVGGDQDGMTLPLEVDLGAFADQPSVMISFRYLGDFANEWSLDWLVVDDQLLVPPLHWPQLPISFVPVDGYRERFDGLAAGLPDHIACNSVDEETREPDAEGWCNVGHLAASQHAYSGLVSLEMGLLPSTTNYHQIANAMIFGFDGSAANNWDMEMRVRQLGEEWNPDDGLFVSADGIDWVPVVADWTHMTGGQMHVDQWRKVSGDLASTSVDVTGNFFLAISQADDFPYNSHDGVAIDDLSIGGGIVALDYQTQNVVSKQYATLSVKGLDPSAFVTFLYSTNGSGPTETIFGTADVGFPTFTLGMIDANSLGEVQVKVRVPSWTQGLTIRTQAVEILGAESRFSNPQADIVQ